jgi:hypothetical protein
VIRGKESVGVRSHSIIFVHLKKVARTRFILPTFTSEPSISAGVQVQNIFIHLPAVALLLDSKHQFVQVQVTSVNLRS